MCDLLKPPASTAHHKISIVLPQGYGRNMDSDDDDHMSHAQSKQYSVLQSDLSAALAAFDRAQDWAVSLGLLTSCI